MTTIQALATVLHNRELPLLLRELDGTEHVLWGWLKEGCDLPALAGLQHPFTTVDENGCVVDLASAIPHLLACTAPPSLSLLWADRTHSDSHSRTADAPYSTGTAYAHPYEPGCNATICTVFL